MGFTILPMGEDANIETRGNNSCNLRYPTLVLWDSKTKARITEEMSKKTVTQVFLIRVVAREIVCLK